MINTYERIKALCAKQGKSIYKVEQETGLGNGVIAGWKTMNPRVDLLVKVADELGVTVDYLVRGETDAAIAD